MIIKKLKPVDYNPRVINESSLKKLKESINYFGVISPLIINNDGRLIAGHQRTKVIKSLGISKVPVFKSSFDIPMHNEIRFNMVHNSVEFNDKQQLIISKEIPFNKFIKVDYEDIELIKSFKRPSYHIEIGKLLNYYGGYGVSIINEKNEIIFNTDYALIIKKLKLPLLVYKLNEYDSNLLEKFMDIDYGEYNYQMLNVKSYNQFLCQMNKRNNMKKKYGTYMKSSLYENYVIPQINKNNKIIDFGAGKLGYVRELRKQNYNIFAYEPFVQYKEKINISAVIKLIKVLENQINKNGLFDICILDSVINSIISDEFEDKVLTTCNSLLNKNGRLYVSTRNKKCIIKKQESQKHRDPSTYLNFLDNNDYSLKFRKGRLTMQKFHTTKSLKNLLQKYFEQVEILGGESGTMIYAICKYPKKLNLKKIEEAINIEFNMEYPNNYYHNQHKGLCKQILEYNKTKYD